MEAILLALLTALCIGMGEFSAHFALRHIRALPGAFFSLCFQCLTLLIVVSVWRHWAIPDWRGPVIFLVSGLLHPGAFFFFVLMSIERLGPARGLTLKSTSPIFGVALAMLLLGERPNWQILLGLFLVAGGMMYLTHEGGHGTGGRRRDILLPLAAAFFSALSPNMAKVGLRYMPDALLGPLFSVIGGMAALFAGNTLRSRRREGRFWLAASPKRGILLLIPWGVLGAVGWVAYFTALTYGSVSQVLPLVQSSPFVVILLSRLLIQDEERVDFRLIVSAVAIVLGAVLITQGRV